MIRKKKDRDEEPSFRFRLGLTGFEASASGSAGIIAAALLAVIAILLVRLPLPW
ncbi:hypothetical protein Mchl_5322 [Methylorubrum extorquens CM4]|uniref:Uncharacterized protein n=1 Tax=Methylorubrum extorquens (strain CM4 / NCIMB 13688) TaxID=440085 RepID=B7KWK6_METC4|nr:hypothetical protein Mchl_5322 [Methylorubrum extorquens CM4]